MSKIVATIATVLLAVLGLSPASADATTPYHCTLRSFVSYRGAGMSHQYETVEFVNVGPSLCVFGGYPTLSGVTNGHVVRVDTERWTGMHPVRRLYVKSGHHFFIDLYALTAYNSPAVTLSLAANIHHRQVSAGSLIATTPGSAYPVYETPAYINPLPNPGENPGGPVVWAPAP